MDKRSDILLACAVIVLLCSVGTASAKTWYVNDGDGADFGTIQDAVHVARSGDTIVVRDGTYTENIKVNKSLTTRSENGPDSTIVQAENTSHDVFEVTADYVTLSGFTVRDAKWTWTTYSCVEKDNGLKSCIGSNIPWQELVSGIHLKSADYCIVSNNKCVNNGRGIFIESSNNNSIYNNTCSHNEEGVYLWYSPNNTLRNNILIGNGIVIRGSSCSWSPLSYKSDIDESNTINGRPVYYWKDVEGRKVPEDAGQIILVNCSNVTVENQNMKNLSVGIQIDCSSYITIRNNTFSNNQVGIRFDGSNNNSIFNNTFLGNKYGVEFHFSNNNSIYNNNCLMNVYIIKSTFSSTNNSIYLNNFMSNINTSNPGSISLLWNSKEQLTYTYNGSTYKNYLGNYWSDYEGKDGEGDGIGDVPYTCSNHIGSMTIVVGSDDYPLIGPWENYIA
jgi:parallel beta-helix repeat protein